MRRQEFVAPIEKHSEFNPRIWAGEQLRPEVIVALENIAEDFQKFVGVPFDIEDLVITGGMASKHYTEHSDLDLHLVVDFDRVECDQEARELFDAKRHLYNRRFNLKIHGVPVEVYIEDSKNPPVGNSYSVKNRKWERQHTDIDFEWNHDQVMKFVGIWQRLFRAALHTQDHALVSRLLKLLMHFRKWGLRQEDGEFNPANLVYKSLRNQGLVQQVRDYIDNLHDRELSLAQERITDTGN